MPASIFGERVAVSKRNGPAWHGIGEVFEDNPSPMDATIRAGCAYDVICVPLSGRAYGQKLDLGHRAIVRQPLPDSPDPIVFGVVGPDYEPIQNMEIAALLEGVAKRYPVDTVGALDQGQRFFITLDTGTADLTGRRGGEIRRFIALTDDKTGGGTMRCMLTDVRIVCQNTFSLAISSAAFNIQVRHTAGALDEAAFRVELMGRMTAAQEDAFQAYRFLMDKKLTAEQIQQAFRTVYADPKPSEKARLFAELSTEGRANVDMAGKTMTMLRETATKHAREVERMGSYRDQGKFLLSRFNAEFPQEANTGWAVYNAITELEDWGRRGTVKSLAASTLLGDRAEIKSRAFDVLMKV
jgi:hypothetical protein